MFRMAWLSNVFVICWICSDTSYVVCLFITSKKQIQQVVLLIWPLVCLQKKFVQLFVYNIFRTPFVKFGCYLTSHIYFMIIQCIVACTPLYPIYRETLFPYWNEWMLMIWVCLLFVFIKISQYQVRKFKKGPGQKKTCKIK